ncbi:HAD family hydrolase [Streptomyces pseudovenezuelae]|uniref:HAD family hydrolase n=1 Tax=Streptomyces pseudovenezuelae TaxID=67350 RepID=UPI0034A10C52
MTRDTTPAALPTASVEDLQKLLPSVRHVLWDLDGPICRLFAVHSAPGIAKELLHVIHKAARVGNLEVPVLPKRSLDDPHAMLVAISHSWPGTEQVVELEQWLTAQELIAADSALMTSHVEPLIHRWGGSLGVPFAVSTNNSGQAAAKFLATAELDAFFPYVCGRTSDLSLMKPHPHTLLVALAALRADPSLALMIGDAPTDYRAAKRAGVAFLGYADTSDKVAKFRRAGVRSSRIVTSLKEIWAALDSQE